jgi:hypothetical protein
VTGVSPAVGCSLRVRKDIQLFEADDGFMTTTRECATEVDMSPSFRLRPIMRQGTASSVPETWTHYRSVDDARAGAKHMYHDDRVLRIMLVMDGAGTFVDWIER